MLARRKRSAGYTVDRKSQWKPVRQRPPRKRMIGFAYEIGMVLRGAGLVDVLISAFGKCDKGRLWVRRMTELLQRIPTVEKRRRVLLFFLRWWSGAVMSGSRWRVIDAAGYVGKKHQWRPSVKVTIDPESGECIETEGKPRLHHWPAKLARGLAGEMDNSPRTCDRYKRDLRGADRTTERGESGPGGLVACKQPDFDGPQAVRPKAEGSKWAYTQSWLLLTPSSEMVRRWTTPAEQRDLSPLERAREGFPLPLDPLGLSEILDEHRQASQPAS